MWGRHVLKLNYLDYLSFLLHIAYADLKSESFEIAVTLFDTTFLFHFIVPEIDRPEEYEFHY